MHIVKKKCIFLFFSQFAILAKILEFFLGWPTTKSDLIDTLNCLFCLFRLIRFSKTSSKMVFIFWEKIFKGIKIKKLFLKFF